jgi:hypothetical protein
VNNCLTYYERINNKVNCSEGKLLLFPNPSTGILTVEGENISSVLICDFIGKVILERKINNDYIKIDLSGYSKAVYFVKVKSDNGVQVEKVVIK